MVQLNDFKIELAAMVDFGKSLVEATYRLEGDGFISPFAFDVIDFVRTAPRYVQHSNLDDVIASLNLTETQKAAALDAALQKILLAYDYINNVFAADPCLRESLALFRNLKWLNPKAAISMDPVNFIPNITATTLLLQHELVVLRTEFPKYMTMANNVQISLTENNLFSWFVSMKDELPMFYVLACRAAIINPSSAMCERIFSMLDTLFKSNQNGMLADSRCAAVMIRYNNIWRIK